MGRGGKLHYWLQMLRIQNLLVYTDLMHSPVRPRTRMFYGSHEEMKLPAILDSKMIPSGASEFSESTIQVRWAQVFARSGTVLRDT